MILRALVESENRCQNPILISCAFPVDAIVSIASLLHDITRRMKIAIAPYHGTDKTDFAAFDVAAAGPYNVGLHFGTREPAQVLSW